MMSIIQTATMKTPATPAAVRRRALCANSSIYTLVIVSAMSGRRFMRRKSLIFAITSPKKGVVERSATTIVKIGTSARSVV